MTFAIAPELVEPVVRGLIGGIDVGDGPTEEQLNVLAAVVVQRMAVAIGSVRACRKSLPVASRMMA